MGIWSYDTEVMSGTLLRVNGSNICGGKRREFDEPDRVPIQWVARFLFRNPPLKEMKPGGCVRIAGQR